MREVKTLKDLVYYADEKFGEEVFLREIVRKNFQDTSYHQFRVNCDAAFGPDAALPPQNLLNPGTLEYRTPDVVIKVNPDRQDLISTRTLGGVNYVLVNGDEGIEINGVPVRFPETE